MRPWGSEWGQVVQIIKCYFYVPIPNLNLLGAIEDFIQLHESNNNSKTLYFSVIVTRHGTVGVRVGSGGSYHRMLFLWSSAMAIRNLNLLGTIEGFLQT